MSRSRFDDERSAPCRSCGCARRRRGAHPPRTGAAPRRCRIEVVGQAASAPELLALVNATRPDVAIIDIRMPPTFTDEGLLAAYQLQLRHPGVGVLVLSQYVDLAYAMKLITDKAERVGYLLKDRITDVTSSLRREAHS
jgi:DNA-binding NarL/FixJ family response regulator